MRTTLLLLCLGLAVISCKNDAKTIENSESEVDVPESRELSTAEAIANAYGYENWDNVTEVQFTFNVKRPNRNFERGWIWKPKTGDVTMIMAGDTVSYNRSNIDSLTQRADAGFINDKYWLLAPFNLVWDEGTSFSEEENVLAPISQDTLNRLTITYGPSGGYTPGDAYDFYYDSEFKIHEWVFREGNDSIPTMTNTWEDHTTQNGIHFAKMHRDSTGGFELFFTNVTIK